MKVWDNWDKVWSEKIIIICSRWVKWPYKQRRNIKGSLIIIQVRGKILVVGREPSRWGFRLLSNRRIHHSVPSYVPSSALCSSMSARTFPRMRLNWNGFCPSASLSSLHLTTRSHTPGSVTQLQSSPSEARPTSWSTPSSPNAPLLYSALGHSDSANQHAISHNCHPFTESLSATITTTTWISTLSMRFRIDSPLSSLQDWIRRMSFPKIAEYKSSIGLRPGK